MKKLDEEQSRFIGGSEGCWPNMCYVLAMVHCTRFGAISYRDLSWLQFYDYMRSCRAKCLAVE